MSTDYLLIVWEFFGVSTRYGSCVLGTNTNLLEISKTDTSGYSLHFTLSGVDG